MEFSYDGLVLSFLDHKIDGNRVKFSGSVENKDITPLFLNNLKIVGGENKDGERDFEADLMSPSEAEKYFSEKYEGFTPKFALFDYPWDPIFSLKACNRKAEEFNKEKQVIIPVLFAAKGSYKDYQWSYEGNVNDHVVIKANEQDYEHVSKAFNHYYESMTEFSNKEKVIFDDSKEPEIKDLFYQGLVFSAYDYKFDDTTTTTDRPNRILFGGYNYGEQENATLQETATFLANVKKIDREDGKLEFEADKLSITEAKHKFDELYGKDMTPLFYIHGFNNLPDYVMGQCTEANEKFKLKNIVTIPVIWPSFGSASSYFGDRHTLAPEGAKEMKKAVESVIAGLNVFPKKNLLSFSMGNWVLRLAANPDIKFDNIFMSAADVRHDIFHTKYIESSDDKETPESTKDGLRIHQMLKTISDGKAEGKIYVMTNWDDYALSGSGYGNRINRLGQAGAGTKDVWFGGWEEDRDLIHPDVKPDVENFDAGPHLGFKDMWAHNYHFMQFAVDFISSKINKGKKRQHDEISHI